MGKRDYRRREPKKPKKNAARLSPEEILASPAQVEVVRKQRKKREDEEAG